MIQFKKAVRAVLALCILAMSFIANAQTNTSSPYSKFGLGELRGDQLPQFIGMGGLSTGIRGFDSYFNINPGNPASYSALYLTTIDIGIFGSHGQMSRGGIKQKNANFNLSHLNFAVPVTKKSALSFGVMPYSSVGYRFSHLSLVDTLQFNHVYSGNGDISKAYFGYGIQLGKQFSIGFNANYLFGTLKDSQEAQPLDIGALNSKVERSRVVNGLNWDYGVQYHTNVGNDLELVIGYSGNISSGMRIKESEVTFRTFGSSTGETQNIPLDSISYSEAQRKSLTMPITHKAGISFSKPNKWLIGADAHFSKWSDYQEGDKNPGLEDSYGFALGGKITPDFTSTNYLKVMDYKLGLRHNKSYVQIEGQDVNEIGVSIGFGLPLPSTRRTTFHKINFSAEFLQRGSSNVHLVKEQFINFHLGFTLNDRWFQRYKYD